MLNCFRMFFASLTIVINNDLIVLIVVLVQLLSDILLLVKDLIWTHLWCVLLMVLQICYSKSKLPGLIRNHRILSITVCHLKYYCIFLIQDILLAQILCLCSDYTAYGNHIQNQLPCNVLLVEVMKSMLL